MDCTSKACKVGGGTAAHVEEQKLDRFYTRCNAQQPTIDCKPIAFDLTGAMGPLTLQLMGQLAGKYSCHTGLTNDAPLRTICKHVNTCLMKSMTPEINDRKSATLPNTNRLCYHNRARGVPVTQRCAFSLDELHQVHRSQRRTSRRSRRTAF